MPSVSHSQAQNERKIIKALHNSGFHKATKIADSLQGSVWRCTQSDTGESMVVKVTSKKLHSSSSVILNGHQVTVLEDIKHEHKILKHLTKHTSCPPSIIRPHAFLESQRNYYLV